MGIALVVCFTATIFLIVASFSLLLALRSKYPTIAPEQFHVFSWAPVAFGITTVFALTLYLSVTWAVRAFSATKLHNEGFRTLFTAIRALNVFSGVSTLTPLFLVAMAAFLWGLQSFRRIRHLETFDSESGFLSFGGPFVEIYNLEYRLRQQFTPSRAC